MVNDPPVVVAPVVPVASIQHTVPDPLRKIVASGLFVLGGICFAAGIVSMVVPSIAGQIDRNAALAVGTSLLGGGGLTIWDRSMPVPVGQ